jgi:hypothetical protein
MKVQVQRYIIVTLRRNNKLMLAGLQNLTFEFGARPIVEDATCISILVKG